MVLYCICGSNAAPLPGPVPADDAALLPYVAAHGKRLFAAYVRMRARVSGIPTDQLQRQADDMYARLLQQPAATQRVMLTRLRNELVTERWREL